MSVKANHYCSFEIFGWVVGLIVLLALPHPAAADDAKVLPQGRWRLRAVTSFSQAEGKYGDDQLTQSLGSPLSRPITANFLTKAGIVKGLDEIAARKNLFKAGEGDQFLNETIADLESSIRTEVYSLTLVAEYGLTSRLSVGLIVPMVHGKTEFEGRLTPSANYLAATEALAPDSSERFLRQSLASSLSLASFNQILQKQYGYNGALASWSGSGLGDIEMGAKYQYFRNTQWRATAKGGVRLPTGREDDPNELLDLAFGDGQIDMGFFSLVDHDVSQRLSFTWELGYTIQLPHSTEVRVPLSEDLPLGLAKTSTTHTPGDFWETALETHLSPLSRVTFSPRYRFKQKFSDSYTGAAAELLETGTSQLLHEGQATLEYSNLAAVRAGRERFPFSVSAFYRMNFAGRNVTDFRSTGLQLKAYF